MNRYNHRTLTLPLLNYNHGAFCYFRAFFHIPLKAKTEHHKNRFKYGELYHLNCCKKVTEKGRTYYEIYKLQKSEEVPEDYRKLSFVCLKQDGVFVSTPVVYQICRKEKKSLGVMDDFHFHTLRHTYTRNMFAGGKKPKDVQELLGHSYVVPQ